MLVFIVVLVWLVVMSVMDVRECRVPVWMLVLGCSFTMMITVVRCVSGMENCGVLLCGMVPGVLLLALALATKLVGYGDGVVLVCLGALSNAKISILILTIGLVLAAIFSLGLLICKKAKRKTTIPFLPFLAAGWILASGIF